MFSKLTLPYGILLSVLMICILLFFKLPNRGLTDIQPKNIVHSETIANNSEIILEEKEAPEEIEDADAPSKPWLFQGWKMISGKEEGDDCSFQVFEGEIKVAGWYSLSEDYMQKTWYLNISYFYDKNGNKVLAKDALDLGSLKLVDASKDLQEKLEIATQSRPYEFTIRGFAVNCDGYLLSAGTGSKVFLEPNKKQLKKPTALREQPDDKSKIIRYYAETAKMLILSESEDGYWYKVEAKDDYGNLIRGWMIKSSF